MNQRLRDINGQKGPHTVWRHQHILRRSHSSPPQLKRHCTRLQARFYNEETQLQRTAEDFDSKAKIYDEDMEEAEGPGMLFQLQLAALQPGDYVLDLATGTGIMAGYIRDDIGPEGRVLGIDISRGMLEQAQEKIDRVPEASNISLMHTSVEDAEFESSSFNAITCANAMMYFSEPLDLLKKCRRWLVKPGGRITFNSPKSPSHPSFPIFERILREEGRALKDPALITGSRINLQNLCKRAGFRYALIKTLLIRSSNADLDDYAEEGWDYAVGSTDFDTLDSDLGHRKMMRIRETFVRAAKEQGRKMLNSSGHVDWVHTVFFVKAVT